MLLVEARRRRFRLGDLETILQLGDAKRGLGAIEVCPIEGSEHLGKAEPFREQALAEGLVCPFQQLVALVRGLELATQRVGILLRAYGHSALAPARAVILAGTGTLAQ
jgi:hypothetical protein